MANRTSRQSAPAAPEGVSGAVAAKARKRRATQRAAAEIGAHPPAKRRNDLAPRLELLTLPTESLKPASRRVRRRDAVQSARIDASLGEFGICRPILIAADHTVVEGHGVWEAAKRLGIAEVPCVVIDHLDANELRRLGAGRRAEEMWPHPPPCEKAPDECGHTLRQQGRRRDVVSS